MSSEFYILVTWLRKEDMQLMKSVIHMNRDTSFGQNYMYWNDVIISQEYASHFAFDEEVVILAVEEIDGLR